LSEFEPTKVLFSSNLLRTFSGITVSDTPKRCENKKIKKLFLFSKFCCIFAAGFFKRMVKQRIIEEASELFGRSGVKSITMDDLARNLGISKRTIYENFKDKESLLISCIDAFHLSNRAFTEKVFLEADNVAEAILTMLQRNAEQVAQQQFSLISDIRKYYPQVYKERLTNLNVHKYKEMEQMIQRGIKEDVFRENLNPKVIAHFFCRQLEDIARNARYLEEFSLSDIFENITMTFLRGICTAKGVEIIDRYKKSKSS
jgi:AcrR family transcriptional regulator